MKKTDVTYLNTQNLTKAIKLKPELPYLVMIKQGLDTIAVLNYGNGKKSCFNFPNSESTLGKELGNIELGLVLPKKKRTWFTFLPRKTDPTIFGKLAVQRMAFQFF